MCNKPDSFVAYCTIQQGWECVGLVELCGKLDSFVTYCTIQRGWECVGVGELYGKSDSLIVYLIQFNKTVGMCGGRIGYSLSGKELCYAQVSI